jgi:hypothetical protein
MTSHMVRRTDADDSRITAAQQILSHSKPKTMASDSDACVPTVVTDFIFDLSDSVTSSQLPEEQIKLYNVVFRELCSNVRTIHFRIVIVCISLFQMCP